MARPKKQTAETTTTNVANNSNVRPEVYIPQQGVKATLTLADFEDNQLFGELRRRGYAGELRYSKVITV